MIDTIVLGLIALAAVFGFIRGIVNQIMSLAGLVCAYLFASMLGSHWAPFVQHQLGCSRFTAEKMALFFTGVSIYLAARLIGYWIEKLVFKKVDGLWKLNRFGGAALGAARATALLAILFFFISLIPEAIVQGWAPKMTESFTYQWAARHNPMGRQSTLEQMRRFRARAVDADTGKKLRESPSLNELLEHYQLKGALQDPRVSKAVQEGNYDELRKVEHMEEFMNDEKLSALLSETETPSPQKSSEKATSKLPGRPLK